MADELTPGDETVPFRAGDGSATFEAAGSFAAHDDTVALDVVETELWQPGPRLAARVPATPATQLSRRGGSGWFIAALIIATAVVIAVGLWLAASSADDDSAAQAIALVVGRFF